MKKVVSVGLLALTVLLFVGCSKPPEAEMNSAKTALDQAKAAEAEQYAQAEYAAARDSLNAANAAKKAQDEKFALFRSYNATKAMYQRAEASANAAAAKAKSEKERWRAEVGTLMTATQEKLAAAEEAVNNAPVGKGNKADIELIKSDLASVKTAYDGAVADYNAGKYISAKSKFEIVSQRAQTIMDEVAAASAKKK
jgi:hypothetical protein